MARNYNLITPIIWKSLYFGINDFRWCECNKSCNTITRDHNCTQTPQGPKCYCPPGFSLAKNGKDCEDLDECQVKDYFFTFCSDLMSNTNKILDI